MPLSSVSYQALVPFYERSDTEPAKPGRSEESIRQSRPSIDPAADLHIIMKPQSSLPMSCSQTSPSTFFSLPPRSPPNIQTNSNCQTIVVSAYPSHPTHVLEKKIYHVPSDSRYTLPHYIPLFKSLQRERGCNVERSRNEPFPSLP